MPRESLNPVIVASYARRFTVEDLDAGIAELGEAHRTSSVTNLSVLGINVGSSMADTENLLWYFEAARQKRIEQEDTTGQATADALDAISPMSHGLDFSRRRIE